MCGTIRPTRMYTHTLHCIYNYVHTHRKLRAQCGCGTTEQWANGRMYASFGLTRKLALMIASTAILGWSRHVSPLACVYVCFESINIVYR